MQKSVIESKCSHGAVGKERDEGGELVIAENRESPEETTEDQVQVEEELPPAEREREREREGGGGGGGGGGGVR